MLLTVKNVGLCGLLIAALHQGRFDFILNLFNRGDILSLAVKSRDDHQFDSGRHCRNISGRNLSRRDKGFGHGIFNLLRFKGYFRTISFDNTFHSTDTSLINRNSAS